MQKIVFIFFLISVALFTKAQHYEPSDATSSIIFKIKNFGLTVDGSFKGLKGDIHFDPASPESSRFNVSINTSTVDTGIALRDKHLKKEDYFNIEEYKTIQFTSSKVEATQQPNKYIVTGKLTIKNTTKEIKFEFTAQKKEAGYLFTGNFTLNRRDYNVGGSSLSMADELTVYLSVMAISKQS